MAMPLVFVSNKLLDISRIILYTWQVVGDGGGK